jgi:hypothetical protein
VCRHRADAFAGSGPNAECGGAEAGDVRRHVRVRRRIRGESAGTALENVGKQTGRLLAGGAALEITGNEIGPFGGVQWGEVHTYDPSQKAYRLLGYQVDGQLWHGTSTVTGNTWRFATTWVIKGVPYSSRVEMTFAADGRSFDWKAEVSTDGKTFVPFAQQKGKKVS